MARRINIITKGAGLIGALLVGATTPYMDLAGIVAPTDGTTGTGAGEARPGSGYTNTATGDRYVNVGTQASPVWSLVGGPSVIRYATVAITNAQFLAIRATPVSLVAAPGAGKRLVFVGASLNLNATAGAYTETADNLAVRYIGTTGQIVSQAVETTGLIDQAGKMHSDILPKIDPITTEAQSVNAALVLHNTGDGEFGGGNAANTIRVTVAYRIVAAL